MPQFSMAVDNHCILTFSSCPVLHHYSKAIGDILHNPRAKESWKFDQTHVLPSGPGLPGNHWRVSANNQHGIGPPFPALAFHSTDSNIGRWIILRSSPHSLHLSESTKQQCYNSRQAKKEQPPWTPQVRTSEPWTATAVLSQQKQPGALGTSRPHLEGAQGDLPDL